LLAIPHSRLFSLRETYGKQKLILAPPITLAHPASFLVIHLFLKPPPSRTQFFTFSARFPNHQHTHHQVQKTQTAPVMKTYLSYSFILAAAACSLATGQTAYTTPVGYVSQKCLPVSDTIVGLPLRIATSAAGALSGNPNLAALPNSAILTVSGTPGFTVNAFSGTCYVKFTSGTSQGKFYTVTSNTASTITVNLNGDNLGAVNTDTFVVCKFWTLAELFVPSASTTDPATTGNAIVVTTSTLSKKTEVLLPNITAAGINLASAGSYYILGGSWRKSGQPTNVSYDNTQLWPDNLFTIRQPNLAVSTSYTISGEVDTGNFVVPLRTQSTVKQDNLVGLPRPVDTTLNALALGGTSAFVTTTSTLSKKDELMVYNNVIAAKNKAASASYYYFNAGWRKSGQPTNIDFGGDIINAGAGFMIRKAIVPNGATSFWNNTASY
jgi:uncharacterized protein (TIGR02597 family)